MSDVDPTAMSQRSDVETANRVHRRDLISCADIDVDDVAASVHVENPFEDLPRQADR